MADEVLINRLTDIVDEITRIGGEQERTSIVPGVLVADASPPDLPTGYIKIVNPRDGTWTPCLTVNGLVINDNDLVNVLFTKGTEPIAISQASNSPSNTLKVSEVWESDFDAVALQSDADGDIGIGTATPDAQLEVLDTAGAQLRLTFEDSVKFADLTVDTNHDLTIDPSSTGQIVLASDDVTIGEDLIHSGDTDTKLIFTNDIVTIDAGGLSILTLENREAVIVDVAETKWVDVPLIDVGSEGSHFRDNDASYPAGWTEADAAEATNTNTLYSFWYLQGSSSETSWKYRKQTSTDLEVDVVGAAIFLWGPIIFKDDPYTADVDYYFGVYRDNAGAIDEDTFSRVHLQWDSAGSQWRIRGELKDSSSGTQTNGSWFVFSSPIDAAFYIATGVVNNAAKTAASYYSVVNIPSTTVIANNWMTTLQFANPTTALTWGDIWLQTHQSRGAGGRDRFLVGAIDRLS
jgi:hypothetical protein